MLQLTKIVHFEMAHAIDGYSGACKNIHGHSYELHVTIALAKESDGYIPSPGFVLDFKELKKIITEIVITKLDHKLVLSNVFIAKQPHFLSQENLVNWEAEPTVENLLIYLQDAITTALPITVILAALKLYETADSYAEWINTNIFK